MTVDQLAIFIILLATLSLFVWGRWRYDLVSLAALFSVFVIGLVPPDQVFLGFGHPAVITVAAVLILSRGLLNAGVVDSLSRLLSRAGSRPTIQVATLTGIVTLCSGFMNNVGALALLMPVAIWMARQSGRSPSYLLMPIAFGSLMGGLITLIGTPPNIIIAAIRAETGAPPFGMFDFTPVGLGVAVAGLAFISLMWRLTPRREGQGSPEELFKIEEYISEVEVPYGAEVVGRSIYELTSEKGKDRDLTVVAVVRGDHHMPAPSWYQTIEAGDILLVEADSEDLKYLIDDRGLKLAECKGDCRAILGDKDIQMSEAIITPGSKMVGKTVIDLDLRHHYGINLLAVARQGHRLKTRLNKTRFVIGDILLLQGSRDKLQPALKSLKCLPLAERGLSMDKPRNILPAVAIFGGAMGLAAFNILPVQVSFMAAAVVMVLAGLVSLDEMYNSIDWPIIVLLGAMFPLGYALESTGGARLIAEKFLLMSDVFPVWAILAAVMAGTMTLSNVVNNAAAAVLMAPIAVSLAHGMNVSVDPLLMSVAIGASCAFLTPVGHQSNMLVMAPGGYRFGDYWRLGLPLSVLTIVIAVPLLMYFWPFTMVDF
ncbi:MAG: SLC13 family permease [Desulfobacteraceae bacterium]|nr:MAG: SLC13 family permease [Desulfobacteraceae bacterium]